MVRIFVRSLVTIGVAGGVIYGIVGAVWSVAVLFTLLGIFYELASLRDMMEYRFAYAQQSLSRLDIFGVNDDKKTPS